VPEQPDRQVEQAGQRAADRGDDQRLGEDGTDVGAREGDEQQRGTRDEERQAGEDLDRSGPSRPDRPRRYPTTMTIPMTTKPSATPFTSPSPPPSPSRVDA
jgi:hypothetical protein